MKRINSVTDALNTNKVQVDVGDGIVIPLPTDGVFGGEQGPAGVGIPTGGTSGQVVQKTASGTIWATPSKDLVGLTKVDNTADIEKPLSEPQALALTTKADLIDGKVPASQVPIDDLGASFIARRGTRGQVRRIYVRADGNDANDGKSAASAYREIRAAVDSLAADGPVVRGSVIIDVGAGIYKGGVRMPLTRGAAQDDFIKIVGPKVGHPAVPTAIIDYAADPTASAGMTFEDGVAAWLEDVKVQGAFAIAVDTRRNVYLWLKNFHADGQKSGTAGGRVGLAINSHCRYYVAGGRIENMVTNGIQELFHVTRSFNNVNSNAEQMTIRNCEVGFQAKENCVGHLDYLNVEDCLTGVEMNGFCVVNVKAISLKRNQLGYANVNSEVHNETGIVWGTGADANAREFISYGSAATELYSAGWSDSATARTANVGHRPLQTVAATYAPKTLVGPLTEGSFVSFPTALRGHRMNTAGKQFKVILRGVVDTTLTAPYRILLRGGSNLLTDVTIPAGTVAGARFEAEFTTVCTADTTAGGVSAQYCFSKLIGEGVGLDFTDPARSADLHSADRTIAITGLATGASDSVTVKACELWA